LCIQSQKGQWHGISISGVNRGGNDFENTRCQWLGLGIACRRPNDCSADCQQDQIALHNVTAFEHVHFTIGSFSPIRSRIAGPFTRIHSSHEWACVYPLEQPQAGLPIFALMPSIVGDWVNRYRIRFESARWPVGIVLASNPELQTEKGSARMGE